jgi:hypothetical protein
VKVDEFEFDKHDDSTFKMVFEGKEKIHAALHRLKFPENMRMEVTVNRSNTPGADNLTITLTGPLKPKLQQMRQHWEYVDRANREDFEQNTEEEYRRDGFIYEDGVWYQVVREDGYEDVDEDGDEQLEDGAADGAGDGDGDDEPRPSALSAQLTGPGSDVPAGSTCLSCNRAMSNGVCLRVGSGRETAGPPPVCTSCQHPIIRGVWRNVSCDASHPAPPEVPIVERDETWEAEMAAAEAQLDQESEMRKRAREERLETDEDLYPEDDQDYMKLGPKHKRARRQETAKNVTHGKTLSEMAQEARQNTKKKASAAKKKPSGRGAKAGPPNPAPASTMQPGPTIDNYQSPSDFDIPADTDDTHEDDALEAALRAELLGEDMETSGDGDGNADGEPVQGNLDVVLNDDDGEQAQAVASTPLSPPVTDGSSPASLNPVAAVKGLATAQQAARNTVKDNEKKRQNPQRRRAPKSKNSQTVPGTPPDECDANNVPENDKADCDQENGGPAKKRKRTNGTVESTAAGCWKCPIDLAIDPRTIWSG